MAVEIPVVVDIEGAFQDAAKRLKANMHQIKSAVEGENIDIFPGIGSSLQKLEEAKTRIKDMVRELSLSLSPKGEEFFSGIIDSLQRGIDALSKARITLNQKGGFDQYITDLSQANIQLLQMREHYRILEEQSMKMSDSINGYTSRLSDLNEKWNRMTSRERESAEGKAIYDQYVRESQALENNVMTLQQKYQAEKQAAAAAKEAAAEAEKLNQAISNGRFQDYVESLSRVNFELLQMSEYYKQLEKSSMRTSTSIEGYTARISDLREQWNRLTQEERESDIGRGIYEEYTKEMDALERLALTLDQKRQKEKDAAAEAEAAAKREAAARKEQADKEAANQARIDALRRKGEQSRRYENAILNSTVKTIRVLQEQERILSERLGRAQIGSEKYRNLKKQLEDVRKEMASLGNETEKTNSKLGTLIKNSLRLVAIHSASRFIKNVREVTSEFELQKVALSSIIQDTEYASDLFMRIKTAAVESPFEIKDLVTYTKQLSAYQIETDKLFDTTMKLADVSAGLGVDMGRLILAFGQVRAASVLRGQELRQFTEAGIPLVDKLAEKFSELNNRTVTTAEVFELISKRAVPFAMIEQIFDDMTSAGGMFYKMQEKQAETLAGQWANLKDAASIMYDEIGRTDVVHGAMTSLIRDAKEILQNWREWARVIKVVGGALIAHTAALKAVAMWDGIVAYAIKAANAEETKREANLRRFTKTLIGKTAAEKISTVATNVHTFAMKRANVAANTLTATLWRLTAAAAKNPFGLIAIAVAALVGWIAQLANKTRDISASINEAEQSISALDKARGETQGLIDAYEELSKKTSLNEKESRKLRDVSKQLAKQFPTTTKAIDDQTGALILDIEKLKEYNKEVQDALIKGNEALIEENNKDINRLEKRVNQITKTLNQGRGWVGASFYYNLDKDTKNAKQLNSELTKGLDDIKRLREENQRLQDSIEGKKPDTPKTPLTIPPIDEGKEKVLQRVRNEISDITNAYKKYLELLEYEGRSDAQMDFDKMFPSLAGWEPTYESMLEKMSEMLKTYSGNADATRLIEQAIANIHFDDVKKKLEDSLNKVSEEIKRSETARNFYNDILGLTGDEDMAATMSLNVYGGVGGEFKDNLQKELNAAFHSLDSDEMTAELVKAFANWDFDTILKNIDKFPKAWQKRLKEMAAEEQKFNADLARNLLQSLEKSKTYGAKRVEIAQKTAKRMAEIEAMSADEAVKEELRKQNAKKEAEEVAKLQYEAFKETPMYVELFSNLDRASTTMLRNMRDNIIQMKAQWTDLAPTEMKELQSRIAELDRQLATKNPFRSLVEGIREYRELAKTQSRGSADQRAADLTNYANIQKELLDLATKEYQEALANNDANSVAVKQAKDALDVQKEETDEAIKAADAAQDVSNNYRLAAKHIHDAAEALEEWAGYVSTSLDGIGEIVNTFASDDVADTFNIISGGINKTLSGAAKFAAGLSMGFAGIPQMIAGLGDIIGGIFGTAQQLKIKKANKEIERQADTIEVLEYQYGRLEKAIEKAFGSDYVTNYNQQLENLAAQQEAYLKQAEAERSKGKKADEDKIKDYENSARDAADKILDMQSQLSEFFSGTDITSAAKDFANSWIEAYKEFGSTTIAMREKFQEMVQEMVEKSLAAKVMQQLLSPIFSEIDRLAQEGGELSVADIAAIAQMADQQIPAINDAMLTLMNTLTQAGYNLRSQPGQFTGIARNIANASEESITGLAAGINTQNFYLSYMPTISANVAAILMHLTGGTADTTGATPITPTNSELVLAYMATLPNIDANLAELLFAFKSVISPKSAATNTHYIAVRN